MVVGGCSSSDNPAASIDAAPQPDGPPPVCGDGHLDPGESCDDGNTVDFDGCSHDCHIEHAMAFKALTVVGPGGGCDLNGDGTIDNVLGNAMSEQLRNYYSTWFTNSNLAMYCDVVSLWYFVGDDPQLQGDFKMALLIGLDTAAPPTGTGKFSGAEPFLVMPDNLDPSGYPIFQVTGRAPGGVFTTDKATVNWPTPYCWDNRTERFAQPESSFTVNGTLQTDPTTGAATHLMVRWCGARGVAAWHAYVGAGLGVGQGTLLDQIVLGYSFGNYTIAPTQPDIDVDHDGLEKLYDTDNDGILDLCVDGNGTQITGVDCPFDPRIVDGFSEAVDGELVGADLAGRAPHP
jgi:cysteine-rich repeat protein